MPQKHGSKSSTLFAGILLVQILLTPYDLNHTLVGMNTSIRNYALLIAKEKGYFTNEGKVFSKSGRCLKGLIRDGYPHFSVKMPKSRRAISVACHRLAALEKFGAEIFVEDIQVRHGDLGAMNFSHANLSIGTQSDNMMDKKPEQRKHQAIVASTNIRKFSDAIMDEIRADRKSGMKYKDLMSKYGITSKGTMSHIIHNSYVTKKN